MIEEKTVKPIDERKKETLIESPEDLIGIVKDLKKIEKLLRNLNQKDIMETEKETGMNKR